MIKQDVVNKILAHARPLKEKCEQVSAFAPTNIALCKYWGKRDAELHLPMTSSLSVSLPDKGATTTLAALAEGKSDNIILNQQPIAPDSEFSRRLVAFLDLFRHGNIFFHVDIHTNIPIAAGLASSACGFAAMTLALNELFNWQLDKTSLSILARLGSGSACRSLWQGFVEWSVGKREDGMDSYAVPLSESWPGLYIGILPISDKTKAISSRDAMRNTVDTSLLYKKWPAICQQDLMQIKQAIKTQDFILLGETAEANALAMHATMQDAKPSISYFLPETLVAMQKIRDCRQQGLNLYFTQDAGPNLKLLFLQQDKNTVKNYFPTLELISLF